MRNSHKRKWLLPASILLIMIMFITIEYVYGEVTTFKWRKLDTMDTNFNIIKNKAGDDDVLLEMNMDNAGTYELRYHLEDARQTLIKFVQTYDQLKIEYHVYENDGLGVISDVTQTLTSLSYLQMNYALTVPDWEFNANKLVGASGGLEYSIPRSASNKYPGVAFEVDNKRVLIKWDFQANKAYVRVDDYQNGKVMPVSYKLPEGTTETIKVLKQLEGFDVKPTHLRYDGAGNYEVVPVVLPNTSGDKPGNKPGLDITFKQPKELDEATWLYQYSLADMNGIKAIIELDDIGSDDYIDFNFNLKSNADSKIYDLNIGTPGYNDNVVYLYDPLTFTYTIRMVEDKSILDPAKQNEFIQWPELAASRIYDMNLGLEVAIGNTSFDDYGFTNYKPIKKFANTYMAYELKRINAEEAYLDITPYNAGQQQEIEYTVLYSKVIKPSLDIDEDLWLKNYHTSLGESDEIFIPVPFRSTSSQDAYQIVISFAGQEIYSQVLNYKAILDLDVPPTTPTIDEVSRVFVVPPLSGLGNLPEKVQFDLVWTALANKTVKELDKIFEDANLNPNDDKLYYELSINDVPTDNEANPFTVVKVFEVYKDAGLYKLRLFEPAGGTAVPLVRVNYLDGYNKTDELFGMQNITLFEGGSWVNGLTTTFDDDNDTYSVIDSGVPIAPEFPGVNYLRLKAITMKDGELSTSPMSVPYGLSMSMKPVDVPIVDTLSYEPLYGSEADRTTGVTLSFHTVQPALYIENMLEPLNLSMTDIHYRVYLAQSSSSLLTLEANDLGYTEMIKDTANLMKLDETEIDLVRNGQVVYFDIATTTADNTDLLMALQGLDVNRQYAIRIVTRFMIEDGVGFLEERRSSPSSILEITVPTIPKEPGDQDITPLAPELFLVSFADESKINAKLEWYLPTEMAFIDDANGFEVLAIEDRSLPLSLRGKDMSTEDILSDPLLEDDVVEVWRIYRHNGTTYLKKYDPYTNTFLDKDLSLLTIENNLFTMIDDANGPNRINYYYVRTVKMTDETVKNASSWVNGTLTTAPVKGPINLTVTYSSPYTYEPKTEFVIYFDAPIPDVAGIGSNYIMEVHVKGESDLNYSTTAYPSTYLGTSTQGPIGYKRLFYRVSGLKPGKTYSIKIRIEDRTKPQEVLPDGSLAYPKSPYSDRIISRTEFDQESYDKENKYYEYLDYYIRRAEAFKELHYFVTTDSQTESSVKYRQTYAEGLVQRSHNDSLKLYVANKAVNTYYIPSEMLSDVNDYNVTLTIETKGHQLGIRPKTVGVRLSKEINEVLDYINSYNSNNKDYYLRIKVFSNTYTGMVNTQKPVSDLVQLELAVVGSKKLEEKMDETMVSQLNSVIEANKTELIAALETELTKGINDARLLAIVEKALTEVKAEYQVQASISFKANLDTTIRSITTLNNSVSYGIKPSSNIGGSNQVSRQINGIWQGTSSTYFNGLYYVESKSLHPLILTSIGSANLVNLYGTTALNMINQFGLSTVFSSYDLSTPTEKVEKYQWISSLSRLLGALPGSDTATYLSGKGIKADSLGNYETIRYEDAIYLYIHSYAYKHNLSLSKVYVTDYGIITDIDQVQTLYRSDFIKAANLGIINLTDGKILPGHNLSVQEAILLLTQLDQGMN